MNIDRFLIVCSVIELTYLALFNGVECYSCFQWAALILLFIKFFFVLFIRKENNPVDNNAL